MRPAACLNCGVTVPRRERAEAVDLLVGVGGMRPVAARKEGLCVDCAERHQAVRIARREAEPILRAVGEWALSRQLDLGQITATHEGIRGRRRFVRFDFCNGLNHMY
jgi:hypothetical protein